MNELELMPADLAIL